MDEQMIALGRRAVACKGWRWLPGAHWILPGTILNGRYRGILLDSDVVPDLTDPATLGCLLALVREAWNDPTVRTSYVTAHYPHRWVALRSGLLGWKAKAYGNTEAEALVAALEAAP